MSGKGGAPTRRSENVSIVQLFQNAGFEEAEVEALIGAIDSICQSLAIGKDSYALKNLVALKIVDLAFRGERDSKQIIDMVVASLRESIGCGATETSD